MDRQAVTKPPLKNTPECAYYINHRDKVREYVCIEPQATYSNARAVFYDSNNKKMKDEYYHGVEGIYTGRWNVTEQIEFDGMIKLRSNIKKPWYLEIGFNKKSGKRRLFYYDQEHQLMNAHNYAGPDDVRDAKKYPYLMRPAYMLDDVQEVLVNDYIIHPFLFTYPKKTIHYSKDENKKNYISTWYTGQYGVVLGLKIALSILGMCKMFLYWENWKR